MTVNKKMVAKRFGKNVATYHQEAFVQKEIVTILHKELLKITSTFNTVFEIGCGSGFLTEKI